MLFDDWMITGTLGGDTLFGHNPLRPGMDGMLGAYGMGGDYTVLDHPTVAFDPISSAFGESYGPSVFEEPLTGAFLINDLPVLLGAVQTPAAMMSTVAISYSMRMLIDMTGSLSTSFSRMAGRR